MFFGQNWIFDVNRKKVKDNFYWPNEYNFYSQNESNQKGFWNIFQWFVSKLYFEAVQVIPTTETDFQVKPTEK